MDAFFAAIEQRDHPEWQGKPVVVGAPPNRRGVVSTASYEARAYGIHSAMPSRTAGKRCPHAIFVPVNGRRYAEVSHQVMDILHRFTPVVEQVSVDEAFLDLNGLGDPVTLARRLKEAIRSELSLTASVGVAPNKFLAKLASDMDKPDGLTVAPTEPDAIRAWLAPLPVRRLWGVGRVAAERLRRFGITTVAELQEPPRDVLQQWCGAALGDHLWRLARGIDERPVVTEREAKSVSNEHTFDVDCDDVRVIRQRLIELTENVGRRLRRVDRRARTGHLKLRFDDFKTVTRQQPLPHPTQADRDLIDCAIRLFEQQPMKRPVRLIGFGVSGLSGHADAPPVQPDLFDDPTEPQARRQTALDLAVDTVRERFGLAALRRGDWQRGRKPPA